ncbi:MAG: DUF2971 domain-containing protein [Clostridium sp.]|uniref:DUF2971 domain-containing protein n=1 Tax=Clostridium sp. TaxID=1506 RepID=UPI00290BB02F|nr:DUF2971 domain-containing protein [Clostridium sp.]MDU4320144.1 DUF2971 domain-containing protein [Clostridium sp.]
MIMVEYNSLFKHRWFNDGYNYEYIYHFTTIDSLIKILLTDTFRLSSVEKMNDINESQPIHKRFGFKLDSSERERIKEKEEYIRSRTFLGCFNILQLGEDIRDKVSMWGHYADSCKGICLKIDKLKLDKLLFDKIYDSENEAIECGLHIEKFPIEYKKQTDIDNEKKHYLISGGGIFPVEYLNIKRMFEVKSEEWKIENEFRYLIYNAMGEEINYYNIDNFSECINCIYIGDMQDEQSIKLLRSIKEKLASSISFYIREDNRERKF